MLYPVIGNDETFVSGLPKEAAREQTWKERLRTECSAEARELRENPTAFSHPDPAGPTGTCGGIGAITEARHHDDSDRVTSAGVQGQDGACAAVGEPHQYPQSR